MRSSESQGALRASPSRRTAAVAALALWLALGPAHVAGPTEPLEIELATKILLKVMLLDMQLQQKTGGQIVVGVAGSPDALRAFGALVGTPIDRSKSISVSEVISIEAFPPDRRPTVVFVGGSADLESATRYTRAHSVLSATNLPELVARGVTLGVGMENNRPKVLLNLTGSESERLKWDTKILKISRRYR